MEEIYLIELKDWCYFFHACIKIALFSTNRRCLRVTMTTAMCWMSCVILPTFFHLRACMLSHFSHVRLCDPMDHSPPSSSVPRVLQARILEWVAMPSSRGSSQPRDQTCISYISCIGRQVLYHWCHLGSPFFHLLPTRKPLGVRSFVCIFQDNFLLRPSDWIWQVNESWVLSIGVGRTFWN